MRTQLIPTLYSVCRHPNNTVFLRIESGDDAVVKDFWDHAVLFAVGTDPYSLIDTAIAEAAKYSGGAKPLRNKTIPKTLDLFAWCSWDAFYSAVSASGVVAGVKSLAAGGTPPKWVVIDDGWQCTDIDADFKKDPLAFPTRRSAAGLTSKDISEKVQRSELLSESDDMSESNLRERFIEGEIEVLSKALKDVPAGTATGRILEEIRALEDLEGSFMGSTLDVETLALQHAPEMLESTYDDEGAAHTTIAVRRRHKKPLIFRLTWAALQYVVGLAAGAFQALVLFFYIWIVDPAAYGSWPVSFFNYLATGPLRNAMLQFYADSTIFTRRLVDIRANSKFSSHEATAEDFHHLRVRHEDLGSVVRYLKKSLGVESVYVWHSLAAYWSGVSPSSPNMEPYAPRLVFAKPTESLCEVEPSLLWNPAVLGGVGIVDNPTQLFQDMHSYLAGAGISGVKVDSQAGVGMAGSAVGGGPYAAALMHQALESSVQQHFPENDIINCMAHSTENIYRWTDSAVARASDDFYPTDKASHIPHITACAYNGLFLSALALPDFDMFHSCSPAAEIHAAARAVSGGPVYVSDAPGNHNFDILRQLVLPDGSILRALLPARPTRDCLFSDVRKDGKSLLKLWNVNRYTSIIGIFNVQGASWDRAKRRFHIHDATPPTLETDISIGDVGLYGDHTSSASIAGFLQAMSGTNNIVGGLTWKQEDGLESKDDWALYTNTTGEVSRVSRRETVNLSVKAKSAVIITIAPICTYFDEKLHFAPIGLTNMLNGGGAIVSICEEGSEERPSSTQHGSRKGLSNKSNNGKFINGGMEKQGTAQALKVTVKGRGTFLAYSSSAPKSCATGEYPLPYSFDEEKKTLEIDVPQVEVGGEQILSIQF